MIVLSPQQHRLLAQADRERFHARSQEVLARLHDAVPGSEAPPDARELRERVAFLESLGYAQETHLLVLLAVFTVFRGFVARDELGPAVRAVVTDPGHDSGEKVHGVVLMLAPPLQRAIVECTSWPAF